MAVVLIDVPTPCLGRMKKTDLRMSPDQTNFITDKANMLKIRRVSLSGAVADLENPIRPPCAPWCTTQPGGAHRRSVVHNVALYPRAGAQHRSHKPKKAGRQTLLNILSPCYTVNNNWLLIVCNQNYILSFTESLTLVKGISLHHVIIWMSFTLWITYTWFKFLAKVKVILFRSPPSGVLHVRGIYTNSSVVLAKRQEKQVEYTATIRAGCWWGYKKSMKAELV